MTGAGGIQRIFGYTDQRIVVCIGDKMKMKWYHKFGIAVAFASTWCFLFHVFVPTLLSGDIDSPFLMYLNNFHEFWLEFATLLFGFLCFADYVLMVWNSKEEPKGLDHKNKTMPKNSNRIKGCFIRILKKYFKSD